MNNEEKQDGEKTTAELPKKPGIKTSDKSKGDSAKPTTEMPKKAETETKITKKGKITFFKTTKGQVITALSLGTILLVGAAGGALYEDFAYRKCPNLSSTSLEDTLIDNKDKTCFDELIEIENYEKYVNQVHELESSLELKLDLESLELERYNAYLKEVDISTLTNADVELLMEYYQESKSKIDFKTPNESTLSFEQTVAKLTSYKNMLTDDTYFDAVESINNYADLLIKSLVVDSLGWVNLDISGMSTNLLDLNTKDVIVSYKSELGKEYNIFINENNSIYYLVSDIRKLNKLVDSSKKMLDLGKSEAVNNRKIHKQYENIINRLKLVQKFDYECNNGTMVQEGDNITKKLY